MNIQTIIVGPIQTNCYLISNEDTAVLIDPGDDVDEILGFLGNKNLKAILLTHGHFDHILALNQIYQNFTTVKIWLHQSDWRLAKNAGQQARLFGFDGNNFDVKFIDAKDNKELKFGNLKFKILATPGHTPGSVCYLIDNCLFSGDTLFKGSIGRTDLSGGDPEQINASLSKLAKLPDNTVIYPGHGPSSTIKTERNFGYLNKNYI